MRSFWHKCSKRIRMLMGLPQPAAHRIRDSAVVPRSVIAIFLLCLAPQDAFAYVDPGSGLLLIQGVLAVLGGAIVFVKDPVAGCKRIWARYFSKSKQQNK